MKTSINRLPKRKKEELLRLKAMILKKIPQTEMIILYGSYAKGTYRNYKEVMDNFPTTFMSDFDLFVITSCAKNKNVGQKLDNIADEFYNNPNMNIEDITAVQFSNEDIKVFNKALSESRYFFVQIKKEGIMLYDSGNYKLAKSRKLSYVEIKQQSEEYYDERFNRALDFLDSANNSYRKIRYKIASFHLHQACENFFHTMHLVYILDNNRQHNLSKLLRSVKGYSLDFMKIFPQDTEEEIRLFELLKAAYVDARYNPKFVNQRGYGCIIT